MIARMDARTPVLEEVWAGLSMRPKSLPSKLFYDAVGSRLFEKITRLPEYYLTRSELEILQDHAAEFAGMAASKNMAIIELGAGTAAKTATLLTTMAARSAAVHYVPVDISPAALQKAQQQLQSCGGKIRVQPMVVDFSDGFGFLRRIPGRKLVLYLGSSIGNLRQDAAIAMLSEVRAELTEGDALLLGTDLVKAPEILLPAYDDAQGVTAAFNKNLLRRLNREFSANFDLDAFRHSAIWNAAQSRIEIYLVSERAQRVRLGVLRREIAFAAGERLHTEDSCKYTIPAVRHMLGAAGFQLVHTWLDRRGWFALHWAQTDQRNPSRAAY